MHPTTQSAVPLIAYVPGRLLDIGRLQVESWCRFACFLYVVLEILCNVVYKAVVWQVYDEVEAQAE